MHNRKFSRKQTSAGYQQEQSKIQTTNNRLLQTTGNGAAYSSLQQTRMIV